MQGLKLYPEINHFNGMLLNFLKSAYRNLVRNKVQSLIQVLSLAIGLTVFTMIVLYLYDELTVDRSNENLKQVYRIENRQAVTGNMGAVQAHMGPVIQENIPEILQMTRMYHVGGSLNINDESGKPVRQVRVNDIILVDSGFLGRIRPECEYRTPVDYPDRIRVQIVVKKNHAIRRELAHSVVGDDDQVDAIQTAGPERSQQQSNGGIDAGDCHRRFA